jgi:hypothetical protein
MAECANPNADSSPPDRFCRLNRKNIKFILRWTGVLVSALSIVFAILTFYGVWSYLRGDTLLYYLAERLDTSYAEVSRQVRPADKEWQPLIRVIKKYTRAKLPGDREPLVFTRSGAVASAKIEAGPNTFAEWTAPTTPISLLYKDFPKSGSGIGPEDVVVVGTLQDLHNWIHDDEVGFDFLFRTIILGVLSACVGLFLILAD